ncbi:MFS transporter [Spelaeicoccus albus]|uniref:MFS family permease n=1 Tax=Spelaeicoccus albus TaxID=1280376 RepID=A0A7Z0D311_9MICO|nr:MFS transporter [Spelaeicoccus albus]NYI67898.1 MFS family permease [Spelaeicoccus albus]
MNSPTSAGRTGPIVAVLAAAGIVASLTQTLVVPLIAQLPAMLHTTAADASWVITVTLLTGAVSTPVAGRLGDLYGKRPMLLVSMIPLVAGSAIAAMASGLVVMVIGRGIQGLAMGMIPLGISLIRDVLPPQKVGTAIALMSSSMGIGGALGLPIAAAVAQDLDWRWLFWGTAAAAAVEFVLIWRLIPAPPVSEAATTRRFDFLGAVGLAAGLVALLLAVSKGSEWGWAGGSTIACFVAAVVILVAWGMWEFRSPAPLVDLRVTISRPVLLTNTASIVVGFGMYAQSLIIPQIMQLPVATGYGLGQTMLQMGLWMIPQGVAMMAVSPLGAKVSARYTPKVTLTIGCLIMAAGYAGATVLMGSTWGLVIATAVSGAGVGFAYGAMPALIMANVPLSETGSANSVNSLMRSIGTSVSAAVIGAVLTGMSVQLGGHAIPTENGFIAALLIGCGAALAAAGIAATIRSTGAKSAERPERELETAA